MSRQHHLSATPGTVHWGSFSASYPAVLRIASGDSVTFDCLSGGPEDLPPASFEILPGHREAIAACPRGPGPHFMTGPVWVNGAKPGHVLEVRIEDVWLRSDWGWNVIRPLMGALPEEFPYLRRLHFAIDRQSMTAALPWGGKLALKPFFGVMGVAPPAAYGAISSREPREHGGNLDIKDLGPGATLYLPVWNEGALFSVGDGHAIQGDGEVCLTALETCLGGTFRLILREDLSFRFPRAETQTHYMTIGLNEDLDEAARQAVRDMIRWIGEIAGLAAADAYSLCSLVCDLHVSQIVDGNKGIHAMLPKSALHAE